MDTPLVKILLIAAAIAITVGVTVLAWSIFNEGSAEVSTDQADRAISTEPGTTADGVRANIDNERACEALGNAHWYDGTAGNRVSPSKYRIDATTEIPNSGDDHNTQDHPATQVDEGEPHCAFASDLRSSARGLVKRVYLCTHASSPPPVGCFDLYELKS